VVKDLANDTFGKSFDGSGSATYAWREKLRLFVETSWQTSGGYRP